MRIVVISDSHSLHRNYGKLPDADVIVHAGDMTTHGKEEELRDFVNWWDKLPYECRIVIAGNHDRCLEYKPELAKLFNGSHYLLDSAVTISGVKFYGSPWTPRYQDFVFMQSRGEDIDKKWDMIPKDTDVLITHGPPHGYGDTNNNGEKVGCENLYSRLWEVRPKYHFYGHIHEDRGIRRLGKTILVNASNHIGLWKTGIESTPPIIIDYYKHQELMSYFLQK